MTRLMSRPRRPTPPQRTCSGWWEWHCTACNRLWETPTRCGARFAQWRHRRTHRLERPR